MTPSMNRTPNNVAAILARVVQPGRGNLSLPAARAFLKLSFGDDDRKRMHELAEINQSGKITSQEKRELEEYLRVGRLLDLLAAKARLAMKRRGRAL